MPKPSRMQKVGIYLQAHEKGLKTIAFWSITGLAAVIGAVLGAATGPAAPIMIPLLMVGFAFLGTMLYAGITRIFNKIDRNNKDQDGRPPIWPDNYHHTKDHRKKNLIQKANKHINNAIDAAASFLDDENEPAHGPKQSNHHSNNYINDGFWKSYQREMRELMVETGKSIAGWVKPSENRDNRDSRRDMVPAPSSRARPTETLSSTRPNIQFSSTTQQSTSETKKAKKEAKKAKKEAKNSTTPTNRKK